MKTLESRIAAARGALLAGIEEKTKDDDKVHFALALPDPTAINGAFAGFPKMIQSVSSGPLDKPTDPWTRFHDEPAPGVIRRSWRITNDTFEGSVNELIAGVPLPMEDSIESPLMVNRDESFLDLVRNHRIPDRRAYLFEEYPESVVAIYREDRIGYSDKQKRFLIWNGHNYAKIKIYKHNGNVKFWVKDNTGAAGKRGKTWCMWASMRNWGFLGRACTPFGGHGMKMARELLSLRPDQEWLRTVVRPEEPSREVEGLPQATATPIAYAIDDHRPNKWRTPHISATYLIPDPGHGIKKYDVSNADRREITSARTFYSKVLKQPVGPQLASLPLVLARKVVEQLNSADRDLIVPLLVENRKQVCDILETNYLMSHMSDPLSVYFLVRFAVDLGTQASLHIVADYLRLCTRLQAKPRLRAQKFSSIREHHDELARLEQEQRETLDAAERQKRREAFKSDPVFEVLESDITYVVEHIRDLDRLEIEGKQMHHCVAGYDRKITDGHCGIASIRERTGTGRWTLELQLGHAAVHKSIMAVQLHGPCNQPAPVEVLQWVQNQLDSLTWDDNKKRFVRKPPKAEVVKARETMDRYLALDAVRGDAVP